MAKKGISMRKNEVFDGKGNLIKSIEVADENLISDDSKQNDILNAMIDVLLYLKQGSSNDINFDSVIEQVKNLAAE